MKVLKEKVRVTAYFTSTVCRAFHFLITATHKWNTSIFPPSLSFPDYTTTHSRTPRPHRLAAPLPTTPLKNEATPEKTASMFWLIIHALPA